MTRLKYLKTMLAPTALGLAVLVGGATNDVSAAVSDGVKSAPANTPVAGSGTSAVSGDLSIPRSIFVLPRTPEQGKDPFYPRSNRPYSIQAPTLVPTTNTPVALLVVPKLTGISGSSERRLAMINNRTFETGEEGDIFSGANRLKIRCLEIGPDSAVIFFNGERRELRLRKGI
jgi:hypothetical protein